MTPQQMEVFVDISINLFEKLSGEKGGVGEGRLVFGRAPFLDYTGMVRVNGHSRGCVCLTMSSDMVEELLKASGDAACAEEDRQDFAGEAASIIANNARRTFGPQFNITTPCEAASGMWNEGDLPYSRFVLPIEWRRHAAFLLLAIEENATPTHR